MLTDNERERYNRQILIPDFGEEGQEKLKNSTVFIAGAGGLGSPVAMYLAAAGIGTIRIADNDRVSISNLNRQILHGDADLGHPKVASAGETLSRLNPGMKTVTLHETITEDNIEELIGDADCIIDAMDNLPARYILNRAAVNTGKPFFHGAVYGYEGRAMTIIPGKSACLYCLYHGATPPVDEIPVLGATAGVTGSIQASEVVKYLTGSGDLLLGRLLCYDGFSMKFMELHVKRDASCEHCGTSTTDGRII